MRYQPRYFIGPVSDMDLGESLGRHWHTRKNALCTASNLGVDDRNGSKPAVTALQHGRLLHPRLADITDSRVLPVLPVAERLSLYAPATLACSKGSGCNLDIVAWLTP